MAAGGFEVPFLPSSGFALVSGLTVDVGVGVALGALAISQPSLSRNQDGRTRRAANMRPFGLILLQDLYGSFSSRSKAVG